MCTWVVAKTHYSDCPILYDIETRTLERCKTAQETGVQCQEPKTTYLGQTINREKCLNYRDESYSQR